jgi:hypothetical protein
MFRKDIRWRLAAIAFAIMSILVIARFALAAEKKEARITQVMREVRVLRSGAGSRPASVNEVLIQGTGVRTGAESRAELTFLDLSLTRLGANTLFSFENGGRDLNLTSGAVLVCVPPQSGSVRISTPAVSAGISGGIAMVETHKASWIKIIVIEGQCVVTLKSSGKTLTLHAGQMIALPAGTKQFTEVENIDLRKLTDNSLLIHFAKLPQWVWDFIEAEIDKQQSSPPTGGRLIDPTGFDKIDQRAATLGQSSPTPSPRPAPSPIPGPTGVPALRRKP